MQLHGAASAKRTVVFGNCSWIRELDLGKLTKAMKDILTSIEPTRQVPNVDGLELITIIYI